MDEHDRLVLQLEAKGATSAKTAAIRALRDAGEDAKPALLRGLGHPAWRVRHGCLRVLDHTIIDNETRLAILGAVDDPHRKVRGAAMHALSCETCKPEGYCGIEGVDLEALWLDVARNDRSAVNRAKAAGSFTWRRGQEGRIEQTMREVLANDENAEVRRRAARALSQRGALRF